MAYFGRSPKKPAQLPGAGHGFVQERGVSRLQRVALRLVTQGRAPRPERLGHTVRAARAGRTGRSAR